MVEIVTYRDLLAALNEIDAWLCSRGLTQQTDRIRRNRRDIALLADAFDEGRLDQFINDAGDDRRRELMWAQAESLEFADSIKALRQRGCDIPIPVLAKALAGPMDLLSESEKSNIGRNTMFEIAVAGRLARAGLQPILGEEPDVHVEFNKRKICVQCKRVFSAGAISGRLKEAASQLRRDLTKSSSPRDCGIVAISVSRAFNKGDKFLRAYDEADLREKLRDEIDRLIRSEVKNYRVVKEPKIAGVLYHLSTPAFLEGIGMYMGAHSVTVKHIDGKSDEVLLENLAESLKTQ